jgi:hypothetical protein
MTGRIAIQTHRIMGGIYENWIRRSKVDEGGGFTSHKPIFSNYGKQAKKHSIQIHVY